MNSQNYAQALWAMIMSILVFYEEFYNYFLCLLFFLDSEMYVEL